MRFKTTKNAADMALHGISIKLDVRDDSVVGLLLTDKKGKILRIAKGEYSSHLQVMIPTPPPTERKHVLSGTIRGVPVREMFDSSHAAQQRLNELSRNIEGDQNSLGVDEEDVPIEETTDVVAHDLNDDVPF